MIQDVKVGTHEIGTYMYAISKCILAQLGLKTRRKSSKSQKRGKKVKWCGL